MERKNRFFGGTIASRASVGELSEVVSKAAKGVPFELEPWNNAPDSRTRFRVLLDRSKCVPPDDGNATWFAIRDALSEAWAQDDLRSVQIVVN